MLTVKWYLPRMVSDDKVQPHSSFLDNPCFFSKISRSLQCMYENEKRGPNRYMCIHPLVVGTQ